MTKRLSGRRIQQIAEVSQCTLEEYPSPSLESDEESTSESSNSTLENWPRRNSKPKSPILYPSSTANSGSFESVTPVPSCETLRSFSSASSWTDDGFEQPATERVQRLFEAIDGHLYDGQELPEECKELQSECQDWINKYPHLRVSGQQLDVVSDLEFPTTTTEFVTRPSSNIDCGLASTSEEEHSQSPSESTQEIQRGVSLRPLSVSEEGESEEILEQEGDYEELIAVDYSDCVLGRSSPDIRSASDQELRRRRIVERLTGQVWNKIVSYLRPFLVKYVDLALQGPPLTHISTTPAIEDFPPISDFPLPRLPTALLMNKGTADLDGLLTITSKTLLNRSTDKGMRNGPHSSTAPSGARQLSPQQGVLSKSSGRGRLLPLERSAKTATQASTNPVKEPQVREPVKQRVVIPGRQHHPLSPSSWGRHFPLPPIESSPPLASTSITLQQKSRPSLTILNRTMSENGNRNVSRRYTSRPLLNSNSFSVSSANTRASHLSSSVENDRSLSLAINTLMIFDGKPKDDRIQSGSIGTRRSTVNATTDHLKNQTAQGIVNRPRRMSLSSYHQSKKSNR